ncbi:MAG: hypothetical protein FD131_366 [Rhodocyclaceae bacterium]|nr:MAG: hypothetical protein FD131_366 [Rhodocyclaceae bacterium]
MMQRGDAGGGQVVGVDVVGVAVVCGAQGGQRLVQTFDGQTVGGVDAGRTQDGDLDASPLAPLTQAAFGINPPTGPRTLRIEASRFVDLRPATVAINPRRAYVNQTPW